MSWFTRLLDWAFRNRKAIITTAKEVDDTLRGTGAQAQPLSYMDVKRQQEQIASATRKKGP